MNLRKQTIILVLGGLALLPSLLVAQPVNPVLLAEVKSTIEQIRHPDQVDMLEMVKAIAPTNTEAYLMAAFDDSSGHAGARLRVLGILSHFPDSPAVRAFLDARMSDNAGNDSLREMAMTSFVRAFYAKDPAGVMKALERVSAARSASVRRHAKTILSSARSGTKHPAGKPFRGRPR